MSIITPILTPNWLYCIKHYNHTKISDLMTDTCIIIYFHYTLSSSTNIGPNFSPITPIDPTRYSNTINHSSINKPFKNICLDMTAATNKPANYVITGITLVLSPPFKTSSITCILLPAAIKKCPRFCKCLRFSKSGFDTFSNSAGCQK